MIQGATPHWWSIGIMLLNDNDAGLLLRTINQDYPLDNQKCCYEMFDYWIRRYPQATWKKLLDALKSHAVGLNSLAYEIKQSKCAKY